MHLFFKFMTAKQLLFFYEQERLRRRRRFLASAEIDNPIPPIVNDFGGGLKFDGVNDFVQTPLSINIANDHSFSFWWKPNLYGGNQRILSSFDGFNIPIGGFIISPTNFVGGFKMLFGIISSVIGNDNCIIYTQNDIPNALMHVVIVKETQTRANWKIYINGVQVSVLTLGSANVASGTMTGDPVRIGAQANQSFFLNADLFDFKIFSKALTQTEITTLFTTKGAVVPPTASGNLVSNYRFANKQGFVLSDISANASNGNLVGYTLQDVTLGFLNKWRLPNGTPALVL